MKNKARFFLVALLLFGFFSCFSKEKKNVLYDTSQVSVIKKVSAEKENEIFSEKDFNYNTEVKAHKSWLDMFLNWLQSLLGKSVSKEPNISYNILKYILIAAFIAGLIFVFWKSRFMAIFSKGSKKLSGVAFNDVPENIEGVNFDALIQDAINKKEFRLAIRWCFLKSLQWLNKQDKITWQPSKTNVDYQHELKETRVKEKFISLSRTFEYIWYGETNCSENFCEEYRRRSEEFISNPYV